MAGKHKNRKKYLEDGSLNPNYKPRLRDLGKILPDGTPNPKYRKRQRDRTYFKNYPFVAWDGEGVDTGEYIGGQGREQLYCILANSLGQEISEKNGLKTEDIFNFIIETDRKVGKGIHVIYGGSYDFNMFLRDLPKNVIEDLCNDEKTGRTFWGSWGIQYVARKYFRLTKIGSPRFIKTGNKWKLNAIHTVTIWDVIGFFQAKFTTAIHKWLEDCPELRLIEEGKAKRGAFDWEEMDYIRKYNQAELAVLVKLMETVRQNIQKMGLTISRWDGAGAVAAAFLKKFEVKKYFADLPEPIQNAAQYAYFGGRVEVGKFGTYLDKVYNYDINSAYPSEQVSLPALTEGRWQYHKKLDCNKVSHMYKLSLYHIKWDFTGSIFCPFPYRSRLQNKILFPEVGEGWVWKPELDAAIQTKNKNLDKGWKIEIIEAWEFVENLDCTRPYKFMEEYYYLRQQMIQRERETGEKHGQEKIIKLGLNSAYGKTAQSAGYHPKTGRIPPYHNLVYAGYITAGTRAKLYAAAMQHPESVVFMATDGIVTTRELTLNCPKDKILGAWERAEYDGVICVQAGFYWYLKGGEWSGWSRGFDKVEGFGSTKEERAADYQRKMIKQIETVQNGWKSLVDKVYFPCTRFITMRSAIRGDWWPLWCSWYKMGSLEGLPGRALQLTVENTKRRIIGYEGGAEKELIQTYPEINFAGQELGGKYVLPWDYVDEATLEGLPARLVENEIRETEEC